MRISIQIPIVDSRIFLNREETGILTKPSWNTPDEKEFVRFFGQIRSRKSRFKTSIYGTNDCAAKRAVRFIGSPIFVSGNLNIDLRIQRHFTFDSLLVGQFEVSATNVLPESGNQLRLTEDKVDKLVRHFLNLKVNILNPRYTAIEDSNPFIECKLQQLPRYIPNAYCKASTIWSKCKNIHPWWVEAGRPCLFLEIKGDEDIELPADWKNVIWKSGFIKKFEFFSANIKGHDQTIPILIFKGISTKDYKIARDVRCCALNLLAANECVRIFLRNAKNSLINQKEVIQRITDYRNKNQLNASFYMCVIDEKKDLFARATLFKLKESRSGLLDKISNLLNELNVSQKKDFFGEVDKLQNTISSTIR